MKTKCYLLLLLLSISSHSQGGNATDPSKDTSTGTSTFFDFSEPYKLSRDSEKKRGIFWAPLGSLLLPGFDQFIEEQYQYGFAYSVLGITGLIYQLNAKRLNEFSQSDLDHLPVDEEERKEREQVKNLSSYRRLIGHFYETAGMLSAYHSFQTAVNSRSSDFDFLKHREKPKEILLAPFEFSFLGRPTTFIPLGLALILAGSNIKAKNHKDRYTSIKDGIFFSGGFSYMAGTSEEAAFRGWLMPVLHYKTGSPIWANVLSASIFGALHYSSDNTIPWGPALMGAYFGYLTQKNSYSLRESIFVHTWWDVIAIGTLLLAKKNGQNVEIYKDLLDISF